MRRATRWLAAIAAATLAAAPAAAQFAPDAAALPGSALAVRDAGSWVVWWNAEQAPVRWHGANAALERAVHWQPGARGVEWAEVELSGAGEAWRTRAVLVRLDPRLLRLRLDTAFTPSLTPAWSIARTPAAAVFAVNAGQFVRDLPWGWLVLDGRQMLAPGAGPLATAVVLDSTGDVSWLSGDSVSRARRRAVWAFESYPALLRGGAVPEPLQAAGRGVDVAHRDARLALGRLGDGRLIVALTRFDALGHTLGVVPFGFTVPEMAALMGALGCRDAVLLDGGISAQLMVRDGGTQRTWRGLRRVPLALVALPR